MTKNKKTEPEGISWYHPAFLLATWFGIGKIPFAPGTWGSLFTLPLFVAMHYLLVVADNATSFSNLFLLCTTILFVLGTWATNVYMRKTEREDPKEVVIDEVVGQLIVFFAAFITLTSMFGLYGTFYNDGAKVQSISQATGIFLNAPQWRAYIIVAVPVYLVCFALFRLFDIWKPWPISYCDENFKGGFGVMFDDIFAAVYAVIALYTLVLLSSLLYSA